MQRDGDIDLPMPTMATGSLNLSPMARSSLILRWVDSHVQWRNMRSFSSPEYNGLSGYSRSESKSANLTGDIAVVRLQKIWNKLGYEIEIFRVEVV